MRLGYCLMCGMLREVNRGVCTQCACDEYERQARKRKHDRALARLADLVIVVDGSKQTLAGSLPNPFFGHVILAFEELVAYYFERDTKN